MAKSEIYRLEGPQATDEPRTVSSVLTFAADRWTSLNYVFSEYLTVVDQKKEQFGGYVKSFDGDEFQKSVAYFIETMTFMGPIANTNGIHLTELFITACLFIIVSWIGTIVGCYLAGFLLSMVFLDFGAALVATVFIPFVATRYYNDFGFRVLPLAGKQILAATFIFEQGVLLGYLNRNNSLSTPFMIIPQIAASFVVPLVLSRYLERTKVFGVVISSTFFAQILIGALFGQLSAGFLFLASIYCFLVVALIQFTLGYRLRIDFDDVFFTMHYMFILAAVKSMGLAMFGAEQMKKHGN